MQWEVGQTVEVQSRTWAGINKPGGCAKITKVHRTADGNYVEGLDVKYLVGGGSEKNVDPAIVSPFETLNRGGRKRRGRDFLHEREEDLKKEETTKNNNDGAQRNLPMEATSLSRSQQAAAEAAALGSSSSRQTSTSFSTPEKRRAKPPKKVTPVPKLVNIGEVSLEVSPMTEDRPSTGSRPRPHETIFPVARGLQFDNDARTEYRPENVEDIKNKSKKVPTKRPGAENEPNCSSEMDCKTATRPLSISTPKQASRSQPASSQKKKIVGVRLKSTTGMVAERSIAQRPIKQSFCRTKSAYSAKDTQQTASKASQKLLLDVFQDEKKKARDFMDEMMAPRSDDLDLGSDDSPGSKTRFMKTSQRYDEFLSTFQTVWMQVDEEEISETRFRQLFQELSSKSPFSPEELDANIEQLCNEGKLMKSDGTLFKI